MAVGAILGWTASILTRSDDGRGILLNVAVGVVATIAAGLLVSSEPLLLGLSATALLAAIAVAVALLGGLYLSRLRTAR